MTLRSWIGVAALVLAGVTSARAQETSAPPADTTAATRTGTPPQPKAPDRPLSEAIYYGASISFSIGTPVRIGIYPAIAYKITPRLSLGIGLSYEYIHYSGVGSSHNFGVSTFGRYRLLPQIYAHGEYRVGNYESLTASGASTRTTVPFLFVGGGYAKEISPRTWAYAEVLFDVLNDPNSPYDPGEPVVNIGVSVGF